MTQCVVIDVTEAWGDWPPTNAALRAGAWWPMCIPLKVRPTAMQQTRADAEVEAARLAGAHPGHRYAVFECVGIVEGKALRDDQRVRGIGPCAAIVPTWHESAEV